MHLSNYPKIFLLLYVTFLFVLNQVNGLTDIKANVKLTVKGNGFHRKFTYHIRTKFPQLHCYVALHTTLPSSIYINPDEIVDLEKKSKNLICLKGEKDVELFEEKALQQYVITCTRLNDKTSLSFLLHQRYYFATDRIDYKGLVFLKPKLYFGCQNSSVLQTESFRVSKKGHSCSKCNKFVDNWYYLPYEFESEPYVWNIPVGNATNLKLVVLITLLITITGAIFILKTIWMIKIYHNYKET